MLRRNRDFFTNGAPRWSTPGTGVRGRPGLYAVLACVGFGLGLVDASMNMQGVAVQRRYGRPVLASFHGVWSAGGIAGALLTAVTAHWDWPLVAALGAVAVPGLAVAL